MFSSKPDPKRFCRCCGAPSPNPEAHRAPILEPLSMEEIGNFIKADHAFYSPRTIISNALARNFRALSDFPLTVAEIYDDLFGVVPFVDREEVEGTLTVLMIERGYRADTHGRHAPKVDL